MAFRLGDDGTLDTVVVCEDCGQAERYNYQGEDESAFEGPGAYQDFIAWALRDAETEHDCTLPFKPTRAGVS